MHVFSQTQSQLHENQSKSSIQSLILRSARPIQDRQDAQRLHLRNKGILSQTKHLLLGFPWWIWFDLQIPSSIWHQGRWENNPKEIQHHPKQCATVPRPSTGGRRGRRAHRDNRVFYHQEILTWLPGSRERWWVGDPAARDRRQTGGDDVEGPKWLNMIIII